MRRGTLGAALALLERLLLPATAFALFASGLSYKLASGLVLAAVFTSRTFAQRALAAQNEAELLFRTAKSVLAGDMLQASVLPDEDARLEIGQGVYHASIILAQVIPNLCADAVASALLALFVASREPAGVVALAAGLTLVSAAALALSRRAVGRSVARASAIQKDIYDLFVDAVDGRVEIVSSGQRRSFLADLDRRTENWGSAGAHVAASTVLAGRLPMLGIAGIVAFALTTRVRPAGPMAMTMADVALFASVTPAFAGIAQGLHAVVLSSRWIHVVAEALRSEKPSKAATIPSPASAARIALEGVTFRYEGACEDALHQVDLVWGSERIVALAGANGSGKSTLLRLLVALADPSRGAIRVDGENLEDLDADAWRARIAFLPQRPYLPSRADVRRSVRWPMNRATDDAVLAALERVALLAVLERMGPDPLAVRVDALSVGQRQRVALARVICRDAWLMVLDEPDANLDSEGVALMAELLRELSKERKVLLAAHSPELLRVAERVVTLREGRVVGNV